MANIVACYKWVIDEADIKVNSDLSVNLHHGKGKISDYDKNAIEAAVNAAAALEGKAVGLTFGNSGAKPSLKDALSRGLEEGYFVNSEKSASADGRMTAMALAAAIKKIEDVALVICAEGASDTYARQTAPRLGALLDFPVITSVNNIEIKGNTLIAVRKLDDCMETVKVELPAVIAVLPEINHPPIPGLKAVMNAGKKKVTEFSDADLGVELSSRNQVLDVKAYVMNRKNIIFNDGDVGEQVKSLVTALKKEGVI